MNEVAQSAKDMTSSDNRPTASPATKLTPLVIGATGIVFGDIGTSPLYTMKTVLALGGGGVDAGAAMGVLSLLLWTLFVVTTIKYINIAMRIDNDGEGGILALMALLGIKSHKRPAIVAMGLFGAALIYGDGAITPAISVLSALEGLKTATPAVTPWILSLAVVILLILFLVQPLGTARIGRAFGPVMLIWFVTIAALGILSIVHHPGVIAAINPLYGLRYLVAHGWRGFMLLGGVFLCVTGAEALYADMGHFGAKPIRIAWSWLIFPSLILNYAGQAALLLSGASGGDNIFYALCPPALLLPVILLATVATIIASQSIITGAFSMTRQAIQLGWLPRLTIKQTSAEGYGQIYVGIVNWLLMIVTIGLTLYFRKSDNLAAAYGIAVSMTMLMTTALLYMAMREIWNWPLTRCAAIAGALLVLDASFFAANSLKLMEGGYVPLLLASLIYLIMWVWHHGAVAMAAALNDKIITAPQLFAELQERRIPRVPGTAVFLTRTASDVPSVLLWHVRQNRVLREEVIILQVAIQSVPWIDNESRISVEPLGPQLWRATARYGFMERPDIPLAVSGCAARAGTVAPSDVTYYLGHETLVERDDDRAIMAWQRYIFAFMVRNSARATNYFRLPADETVEIGRTVAI
ncbi:MAG TPA: KUP/HAK/KT family potassium transporter [Sphingomonas sp.]|nr:KUP/HAK/KT family potassium transporter [Sphingomonas sp.]